MKSVFYGLHKRLPLDFKQNTSYNSHSDYALEWRFLSNTYGSDYITITDDDGNEYELEVLNTIEYNGCSYLAVIPAEGDGADSVNLQVFIIKSVEENGEPILYTVDNEDELSTVNDLLMDSIYSQPIEDWHPA